MVNKKIIGLLVCILFFGASIIPSISGNIKQIKNNEVDNFEKVPISDPNLIGYWSFNEGSGCNDYSDNHYSIMHPTIEMYDEWLEEYYDSIEKAALMENEVSVLLAGDPLSSHFDLLDHFWYCPENRSQGDCGNCWAWTSTGCMEVELYEDWGIKDRLSVQWLNSVFLDGNKYGNQPWACCGRSATTFANFYTDNTTIAIPWNNSNADHIDEPQICTDQTLQDASGISTYPYYKIDSIAAYGLPTYGLTQEQAINNIKTKLCENKAMYYWFALPSVADWEDPPNGFKYVWSNYDENTIWSPDFAQGHEWVEGEGGGHAVLCVGWDETNPNNPYWIMINSWSTTPDRPNGIWHLDMNTNYSMWFWDPINQQERQAQGFEYFNIDFGLSPNPPSVDAGGPYSNDEGSSITLTATGSDPDGDSLRYRYALPTSF